MRFLIRSEAQFAAPPEAMPDILERLLGWVDRHTESGKIETIWSNAGAPHGGAILNVSSLEELDEIMAEFPLVPFSKIHVTPITNLQESVERTMRVMRNMGRR